MRNAMGVLLLLGLVGCGPKEPPPPPPADTAAVEAQAPPAAAAPDSLPSAPIQRATAKVPAPDFAVTTLDGQRLRLADLRGQVVVLNFWATWCGPCRYEIPDLVALQQELGPDGLQVVGISLDEEAALVEPFVEEYGITYPVAVDDGTFQRTYGPFAFLPATYVIDRQGIATHYAAGMVTRSALAPILRALLDAS